VENRFYILYKPTGEEYLTRSMTSLLEVHHDDGNGIYRFGCWFAVMTLSLNVGEKIVIPRDSLGKSITRNILALPLVTMMGGKPEIIQSEAKYYLIGDDWDESVNGGAFIKSHITEYLFHTWNK
jgi:hypothetical protein